MDTQQLVELASKYKEIHYSMHPHIFIMLNVDVKLKTINIDFPKLIDSMQINFYRQMLINKLETMNIENKIIEKIFV